MAEPCESLPRWDGENYIGDRYPEYYVLAARSRYSDIQEQSNYDAALRMIGGLSDTVIVVHSTHWMVKWLDTLLVHQDDTAAVAMAQSIVAKLKEYPYLDEDDYNERKAERRAEYRKDIEEHPEQWEFEDIMKRYGDIELYLDTLEY